MLFSLIVVILLLAIAFFQSTQGLFSSLIMAVLSLCCAALAVGSYEFVAVHYLAPMWQPNFSFALALALLFGVPLIILRVTADKLVRRSCHIHGLFDRIGGGFCGIRRLVLSDQTEAARSSRRSPRTHLGTVRRPLHLRVPASP